MIVYKLTNNINGKIYVGSTTKRSVEERWGRKLNKKGGFLIVSAIKIYGYENFSSEIIEVVDGNEELLRERESYWTEVLDSTNPDIGYNSQDPSTGEMNFESLFQRVSKYINKENKRKRIFTESKYPGVFYEKARGKWKYEISIKNIYLQSKNFTTQEDAAIAKDIALILNFGEKAKDLLSFKENFEKYINKEITTPEKIRKIPQKRSFYKGVSFDSKNKLWLACFAKSSKNNKKIKKGMFKTEIEAAEIADLISIQEVFDSPLNFPMQKYLDKDYKIPLSVLAQRKSTPYKGISFDKKHNRYEITIYDKAKIIEKKTKKTLEEAIIYRKESLDKFGIDEKSYDNNLNSSYELDFDKIKENIIKYYSKDKR